MEMNQNQIIKLLDILYAKSINGIPKHTKCLLKEILVH